MPRRKSKHRTGISRIEGIPFNDAWIFYSCINCHEINYIKIGKGLIKPKEAFEEWILICDHCGFIHSKESDIPFDNWDDELKDAESKPAEYFWRGFFRSIVEDHSSYWKQCNVCGRILPFKAFSKHSSWGPLERQMECRACKGAINAKLNPQRSDQQMHEASVVRRIADIFLEGENETIDINELFERFEGKCYKTKKELEINDRETWAIDHILPSKWLYPLNKNNAALLSKEANANKRDKWPSEFFTNNELIELAKITGADLTILSEKTPIPNDNIDVNKGVERYLRVREQSDLNKIIKELKKIIRLYKLEDRLNDENKKLLGLE